MMPSIREVKCLQGYSKMLQMGKKILRLSLLVVEHSVVVMTVCSQSKRSQIVSYG